MAASIATQRAEEAVAAYLVRRSMRRSVNDIIVAVLAKVTGKTEERIRQELSIGG